MRKNSPFKLFAVSGLVMLMLVSAACTRLPERDDSEKETDMKNYTTLAQFRMATMLASDYSRMPLMWTQQLSGVRGSFLQMERYHLEDTYFNEIWRSNYFDLVFLLHTIDRHAAELNAPVFRGMSKVLYALALGMFTDAFGDVPFSQVVRYYDGSGRPAYDTQQQIYAGIQTLLDEALDLFSQSAGGRLHPSPENDIFFKGSVDKWEKAARLIRLRYSLRLSHRSGDYSASLALIQAGGLFTSNEDNMAFYYADYSDVVNPWYAFDFQVGNARVGQKITEMLKATEDPRLGRFIRRNLQNEYLGAAPGSGNLSASRTANASGSIAHQDSPMNILTYTEQKFIEAEVYLRSNLQAAGDAAYNQGVRASLEQFGLNNPEWVAVHANRSGVSLEDIINAKYIALFLNPEVWTDYRRTGFPLLTPPADDGNEGILPRRFLYPASERQDNAENLPPGVDLSTRLWWDIQ